MNPVLEEVENILADLFNECGAPADSALLSLRPCNDKKYGDYQSNGAMSAAKTAGKNPRAIAELIAATWESRHAATASVTVAGPGFINFAFTDATLLRALEHRTRGQFVGRPHKIKTVIMDYGSPNVAKSMHVGHIRSTILGDCLARVMRLLGHTVITDNHIGDWGTQFGKLIIGFRRVGSAGDLESNPIAEMERCYKWGNEACERDSQLMEQARAELKKLQDGLEENLALWKKFRDLSQSAFDLIYRRLNVKFDHVLGESFYNPMLQEVVDDLVRLGVARESQGAVAVFSEETLPVKEDPFRVLGKDGATEDRPFLIQKSDGAALYGTTDLATIRYRMDHFKPDAIWYITDLRQKLHFEQLFATAERWGYREVELTHIGFGAILGADKRPLKTREGDPIKLDVLLDESVTRALAIVRDRRSDLTLEEKQAIAEVLGISSVKYADLSQNRHLDYVFDWNKMLAFDGNTAPYVLNAHVRIRSIFRKSGDDPNRTYTLAAPAHPKERDLMLKLLEWEDIVEQVAAEQRPHYLCFYLFSLAGLFHSFFEECPVLKAEPSERERRMALCKLTADTLQKGCELLGIPALEHM